MNYKLTSQEIIHVVVLMHNITSMILHYRKASTFWNPRGKTNCWRCKGLKILHQRNHLYREMVQWPPQLRCVLYTHSINCVACFLC